MDQPVISERDASDPKLLRALLQRIMGYAYDLLGRVTGIESMLSSVSAKQGDLGFALGNVRGLTQSEQQLLASLATGSTDNPVSAQNAVVPAVSALPPVQSAVNGQLAYLESDQHIYRFDASPSPGSWVDIASSGGGVLSGTYAARPAAASVAANTIYYATDRAVAWVNVGGTWTYLCGIEYNLLVNAPALGAGDAGYLFYAVNYNHLWEWDGAKWNWGPGEAGSGYFIFAAYTPDFTGANAVGVCNGSSYNVAQYDMSLVSVTTPDLTTVSGGVAGGFLKARSATYGGGGAPDGGGSATAAASAASFNAGAGATAVSTAAHTHAIGLSAGAAPIEPVYWDVMVFLRR